MSPLFGSKDKNDDHPGDAGLVAEAQRLASLPLRSWRRR